MIRRSDDVAGPMAQDAGGCSVLGMATATALCLGILDLLIALTRYPKPHYPNLFTMCEPLAASVVAAAVLCALAVPIAIFAGRNSGRSRGALSATCLFFLLVVLVSAALADMIPPGIGEPKSSSGDHLIKFGLIVAIASMASIGLLPTLERFMNGAGACRRLESALCFTAWALAETLILVWLHKYHLPPFLSPPSLLAIGGFCIVVGVTLSIHLLANRLGYPRLPLLILSVAILASPALMFSEGASRRGANTDSHNIPHVILIVVDTLRADALSVYDADTRLTPNIDRFANDGVIFRNAISPGPWTVPAMGSIMTGTSPQTHAMDYFGARIPEQMPTLAEFMRRSGYATGAVVDNGNLNRSTGFARGFDSFRSFPDWRRLDNSVGASLLARIDPRRYQSSATTPLLIDLAKDWVDEHLEDDFFFWLHLYDPHQPYEPPREFMPQWNPPAGMSERFGEGDIANAAIGKSARTTEERRWVHALYGGEVLLVDDQLGRFLQMLRNRGLYESSLIILTSDHGEEFWEHGNFEHGQSLYTELLHVPLIVKLPASTLRGSIDQVVSTASVLPTILDFAGVPYDPNDFAVLSLRGSMGGGEETHHDAALSGGLMRGDERESIRSDHFALIRSLPTGREELYDHSSDPGEQTDISASHPGTLREQRQQLRASIERAEALRTRKGLPDDRSDLELDETSREILKQMGYLQ